MSWDVPDLSASELVRRIRSAIEVSVDYDHWADDRGYILYLCDKAIGKAETMSGDAPDAPGIQIQVNCFNGGGIEVVVSNWRPLSMHVRAVEVTWAAEVIGDMVSALVAEWVRNQQADGRIHLTQQVLS